MRVEEIRTPETTNVISPKPIPFDQTLGTPSTQKKRIKNN